MINNAKPFLKWAGGKSQLIPTLSEKLPSDFHTGKYTYIEPFIGSGAMLFWIISKYPKLKNIIINDINSDLIACYKVIKDDVEQLIHHLQKLENEYNSLEHNSDKRKNYYYDKRTLFNKRCNNLLIQSSLFIFLNKTCFNGLYRVNKKNKFNVPQGSYKNPRICDEANLRAVADVLKKVIILNKDFYETIEYIEEKTFVYLDPPYKPLSNTSSFNSYTNIDFNDEEQLRLKEFIDDLNRKGAKVLLSNSDLKSKDPKDDFFDNLYKDYRIERVLAKRMINSKAAKRGKLTELLISNI